MPSSIIVDCHSHIFNAEDLPIDGFIKRMSPVPSLLTGVLSRPFDLLAAWAAPGSAEASFLIARISGAVGLENVSSGVVAETDVHLISDAELDLRLVEFWPLAEPVAAGGLESGATTADELIAQRIAEASPEQLAELDSWLSEWGDLDLDGAISPGAAGLESIGNLVGRANALRKGAQRFVAALRLVTRHRHRIAADLAQTYPDVRLFVPALVDFSHTTRDDPSTPIPEQIAIHSLVAKLSIVGGIPGAPDVRIHPMVGFCPYREIAESELANWNVDTGTPNDYIPYADPATAAAEDRYSPHLVYDPARAKRLSAPAGPWPSARLEIRHVTRSVDLVRHAVELGGFAGVKLYPPSGFLPIDNVGRFGERLGGQLDAALRALYAYCMSQEVPMLTHAARSMGFQRGFDDLAAPTAWRRVLQEYPTLRLCFGHFGHLQGVPTDAANPAMTSWPHRFIQLVDAYPHVYADVGNSKYIVDSDYRARYTLFLREILGPADSNDPNFEKRRRRVMFGSDYWMNTLGPDHRRYLDVFSQGIEELLGPAVRSSFTGANALRWLGVTNEDDAPNTMNLNRQRLVDFYGAQTRPDWLG